MSTKILDTYVIIKIFDFGAGEMGHWSRTLATFAEELAFESQYPLQEAYSLDLWPIMCMWNIAP